MIWPIVGVVAAIGSYVLYRRHQTTANYQAATGKVASALIAGKQYAIQLMFNPSNVPLGTPLEAASQMLSSYLAASGWSLGGTVQPFDATAASNFANNQPSLWAVTPAVWTSNAPYSTMPAPPYVGMVMPYLLPNQ